VIGLRRVEAIHVRVPFRRPLLDATGEFTHRRSWLLRVVDESGNQGLGEAALNPFAEEVTTDALARLIRALVPEIAAGRLPAWPDMAAEGEPGRAAMAAVDGAVAALEAVRRGESERPPVAVCAVINFAGPDAGADAAAQAVELGFETLKIRAGFERTTDQLVDRVRAIRGAVGPGPRLRVDVSGAWDLEIAIERIYALEPFRIEFVEQPLAAWDIGGHATLRGRVEVPIALDESIDSEYSVRAALDAGAADVLVVRPVRVGGSAATSRIAAAAARQGVAIILATYFETGVGIAAALRLADTLRATAVSAHPRAHALATAGLLLSDMLAAPLAIENGEMEVPANAALDESQVDRYALERVEALG
jgi:L-alanine-DL-glutamate epimerase-like enolase superfamily enzyme